MSGRFFFVRFWIMTPSPIEKNTIWAFENEMPKRTFTLERGKWRTEVFAVANLGNVM
jgi:hypothetical protein